LSSYVYIISSVPALDIEIHLIDRFLRAR